MHLGRCWIRSLPLVLLLLLPALGASATNWRDLQQVGAVAYFLVQQSSGASVERFQMDASGPGTRLAGLPLSTSPSGPLAFFVDDSEEIYVAYSDHIDHVPTSGAVEKVVDIAAGTVALYGVGDFLFVVRSASGTGITVQPVDKVHKTTTDLRTPSTRQGSGVAFDRANGQVFAFAPDSSGVLLLSFPLGLDGSVGSAVEAHIPTPLAGARLFPFADGTRVADAGGTVYSASDLLPLDSFGGAVSSLAFHDDVPFVLRGAQVVSFSNTLQQADVKTFPTSGDPPPPLLPSAILVQEHRLWAFSDDNDKNADGSSMILSAQAFQLPTETGPTADPDFARTPKPNAPITLGNTAFTPDGVAFDESTGTLFLLDAADLRLFRWTAAGGELPAVQLQDTPRFLAVSDVNGQLQIYLGYSGGAVKQLSLTTPPSFSPYTDVKAPLCGLVAADALVVTCQKGASSATTTSTPTPTPTPRHAARGGRGPGGSSTNAFYTSFAGGSQRSQASAPLGSGLVWSSQAGRLYFLTGSGTSQGARGAQVAALPLASDGSFGALVSSSISSSSFRRRLISLALPIVPSPDGAMLLLGSGQQLDAQSLALLPGTLPAPSGAGALVDAATQQTPQGPALWTFRSVGGVAEADLVSGGSVASRALFEGAPLRLFALDAELVALTSVAGVPTPRLWGIVPAQPLASTLRFASTAATPLFDLAALHFSEPGSNSELTFDTIEMSESGQVGPSGGQIQFTLQTPPETAAVDLSGSLTGSGASTTAQLHFVYHDGTLNGQPFSGTTDMKLTAFDATSNALTGSQTLNFEIGRQRLSRSTAATWTLPAGVDGSWTLDVTLNQPNSNTITGTATLRVHPGASDSVVPARTVQNVPLTGTVDPTGHATLSGASGGATVTLDDVTPLARGVAGTVGVQWLGQDRSADLSGTPAN